MPLAEDYKMPAPTQYPVVDDDTYNVAIADIEEIEGTNFNTGAPEPMLKFLFEIMDGDSKGEYIQKWVSLKYAPSKAGRTESNLHAIVTKAMPTEPDNIQEFNLNQLIGKDMRIVVTKVAGQDGFMKNKIVSYMTPKKSTGKTTLEAAAEKNEEVDIDQVPFP